MSKDIEDLTFKEIRKEIARLEGNTRALGEMTATLIVNCQPDRPLHRLGVEYNENKSLAFNLDCILRALVEKINAKTR